MSVNEFGIKRSSSGNIWLAMMLDEQQLGSIKTYQQRRLNKVSGKCYQLSLLIRAFLAHRLSLYNFDTGP